MNIFYLDSLPSVAAKSHCDQHVSKMCIEYAQLMSTAHHLCDTDLDRSEIYKPTHVNHPSAIWVRSNRLHYDWTFRLWFSLLSEFRWRRGKSHGSQRLLRLLHTPPRLAVSEFIEPPQCMPDEFKQPCTIAAYRAYYHSKTFASWRWRREAPHWFSGSTSPALHSESHV